MIPKSSHSEIRWVYLFFLFRGLIYLQKRHQPELLSGRTLDKCVHSHKRHHNQDTERLPHYPPPSPFMPLCPHPRPRQPFPAPSHCAGTSWKQRPTVCVLGHSAYGREVAVGGEYPLSSLFTAESFSTIWTHLLCVHPNIKRVLACVDAPGSSAPLVPWLRAGLVPAGAARRGQAGRGRWGPCRAPSAPVP